MHSSSLKVSLGKKSALMAIAASAALATVSGTTLVAAAEGTGSTMKMTVHSQPGPAQDKKAESAAPQKAIPFEVPALPEVPKTAEMIERVKRLEEEGNAHFQKREFDKAIQKWQEAYALSLDMNYPEGEGRALSNMCRLYYVRGQVAKAKELGEHAIELLFNSGDKRGLAKARIALAQVYFGMDNAKLAGDQLQWALETFSSLGNEDSPDAANVMTMAAGVAWARGFHKECVQFLQGAASHYERAGDLDSAIRERTAATSFMLRMGWFTAAYEEAQKILELAKGGKSQEQLAAAYALLGGCQFNLCEYANACKSYEESFRLGAKSPSDLDKANICANYGTALAAVGDRELARVYLDKALVLMKSKASSDVVAKVQNILGSLECQEGNFAKATMYLKQAVDNLSIAKGKDARFSVVLQQNLAAVESRSGNNRLAKEHLASALESFRKFKDTRMEGRTYTALAEVLWNLKDPQQTQTYLQKGIEISQRVNDDAALWRDYVLQAELELLQNQPEKAGESLKSALSFFRSPRAGYFPSPERLEFPSTREELGHRLVCLLAQQSMVESALLAAEQLKEESFINEWNRRGGEVKPGDREVYNDLVVQRLHLHAAEETDESGRIIKEWQNWLSRFKQLAGENRTLARLVAPVPMSVQDIIKEAGRNHAVVLDYLVGKKSTILFTIDSLGRLAATTLNVGSSQIAPQVASLFSSSSRQTERRTLQLLYSELLPADARSVLPTNPDQTVVIVADGILFNLPFAALLNEQGKYLVENHTLTMAPSMGVFLDSPPQYSHDLSVVFAAGPDSSPEKDEGSVLSTAFEPDLVTRLNGKDADIGNFEEQAKGKAVVHFASSVPFRDTNPLRAELPVLSDKSEQKVTANRLFGLNLPNDLVVLSATAVNANDLQGNAVKVFSRGFNYAGVRNVLMSLWVEPGSQRTAELVEFYRSKQKGLSQAQSLRRAQMLSMSRDPSPRSWAAFQLLGPGN